MRYFALALGFSVFALDLLSKWFIKKTIWLHEYTVIDGFFTIQYVRNEGIAFGLFHSIDSVWKPILLSLIAVLAVVFVVYYILKTPSSEKLSFLALGLLLGGILGNFTDRLLHQYVFDFLTLHWQNKFAWPTFNLADSAISTGVTIILIKTILDSRKTATMASLLLISLVSIRPCSAQEIDSIIDSLQSKYNRIESFSADFEQTFASRGIEIKETGIVMMKRPGRMYWEYIEPTEKYFVADGKNTYFYIPRDRQVLVTDLDLGDIESPLLFLLGRGDFRRDFNAQFENPGDMDPANESTIKLRLIPKKPHPEFTHLILEIERERYLIQKLTVVEPIGQQNQYSLTNVKENVQIPNKRFDLKIPSSVEVIEQ